MLVKYKQAFHKIAMGLLSYMPTEKDLKKLLETMEQYDKNEKWDLYLWKEEDIVGVIGIQHLGGGDILLQHVSVNPSFRQEGIGRKMIDAIREKAEGTLIPTKETEDFLEACLQ